MPTSSSRGKGPQPRDRDEMAANLSHSACGIEKSITAHERRLIGGIKHELAEIR
jgi:hypothetical protein